MDTFTFLFPMAALGLSISAYLIKERKKEEAPVCPIGGDCKAVLTSKYNKTLGIYNDVLGIVFYASMIALTAFVLIGIDPISVWERLVIVAVTIGSIMSLRFIYLQWKVIKAWCFWCLMSALTIGVMEAVLIIYGFRLVV